MPDPTTTAQDRPDRQPLDETLTYNGRPLRFEPTIVWCALPDVIRWADIARALRAGRLTSAFLVFEPGDATRYELLFTVVRDWQGEPRLYITRWRGEHDLVGGLFVRFVELLNPEFEFDLWMMEESRIMDRNAWTAALLASVLNVFTKAFRAVPLS